VATETKWDILTERAAFLRMQAQVIEEELAGLDATPLDGACPCGFVFVTEGGFARHFIVPSRAYLNLGDCPNRLNPGELPARYAVPGVPPGPDCGECGAEVPRDADRVEGPWHAEACSLHPSNIS
jgi:hypothetical protein